MEAPVMNDRQCCLCSQIQGQPDDDLIAAMLPDQPYIRRVLLETESFAAIPSLGPLVRGHSLLCPKTHLRSFAELPRDLDQEFLSVKEELRGALARLYEAPVHLFEHGMATGGTRTLCTVDHAHLHFVPLLLPPFGSDLAADGQWMSFEGSLQELRVFAGGGEYVFYEAPDGSGTLLRPEAEDLESQYMRKLFAKSMGRADQWDWRASPKAASADEAWQRFVRFIHGDQACATSGIR
jgi:ATP adenylyltransferase